jgi:hypothetical protein
VNRKKLKNYKNEVLLDNSCTYYVFLIDLNIFSFANIEKADKNQLKKCADELIINGDC